MFKARIVLLSIVVFIYYLSTYCMISRDTCMYYADYYIFASRSFTLKEEHKFDVLPIKQITNLFQEYQFCENDTNIKSIGFVHYGKKGFWSNGKYAKFSFKIRQPYSDIKIEFDIAPFINKYNREITTVVLLNNSPIREWKFEYGRKKPKTIIKIPRKSIPKDNQFNLSFRIEGCNSPFNLGLGQEHNKLGLSFNSMKITPYIEQK